MAAAERLGIVERLERTRGREGGRHVLAARAAGWLPDDDRLQDRLEVSVGVVDGLGRRHRAASA